MVLNKKKSIAPAAELKLAEDDDLARAKIFWNEWGKPILVAVILGLGGIGGFNYWQNYQLKNSQEASVLYEQVLNSDSMELAKADFEMLKNHFSSLTYSQLAAFYVAKLLIDEGRIDEAAIELEWVLEQAKDEKIQHIARLRLVAVMLSTGQFDEAISIIKGSGMGVFDSRYQELLGDAYMLRNQEGDRALAREAYQTSLNANSDYFNRQQYVRAKLDNL